MDWYVGSNFNNPIILLVWGLAFLVILLVIYCFWLRLIYNLKEKKRKKIFLIWEEMIFEYLDRKKTPSEIVESMSKSEYNYFLDFLENYLITIKGEDLERIAALITKTKLFFYLIDNLKRGSKQKRKLAAHFLGLARAGKSKEFLEEGLNDRDDSVAYNCALALAKLGAIDIVNDILIQYRQRKKYSSDLLLNVLFDFGNNICPPLLQQLEEEKDEFLCILIIDVLGYYRYYSAGEKILDFLNKSTNRELRIHCLKAIGRMEYIEALPAIRKCLDEHDWVIRSQAIQSIGKIGDVSVEKKLIENLYCENWWVRYRAAEALFNLSESGKKILEKVVDQSKDKKATIAAQIVLTEKAMV
ncbi:HEAT repeat domain-containing protein [Candidatus Atribacteria bacterium MT.SAG.1]|nr:HEAT repeat domain-containing protein [Candidatus Atribacteria bacterium MT.SAG.1]